MINLITNVLRHKWYVLVAGLRIGGIPFWRLLVHDLSKLSWVEAPVYARRYPPRGRPACPTAEWLPAWLHHIHHNPHHWEYWVIPGRGPIPMPEHFVREMVADWIGAGRAYTETLDVGPWLAQNYHAMILHPSTIARLNIILADQGIASPWITTDSTAS